MGYLNSPVIAHSLVGNIITTSNVIEHARKLLLSIHNQDIPEKEPKGQHNWLNFRKSS